MPLKPYRFFPCLKGETWCTHCLQVDGFGLEPGGWDCWAVDGSGEGWVAVVLAVPALHDDLFEGLFVGGAVHLGDGGDGTVGGVFDDLVY